MGAISKEELARNQVQYVSIDKDNGGFIFEEKNYPGFEGIFLGINSHEYEFKGRIQSKLDIFLFDKTIYQLEFGKYSWLAFKLLNQLMSIPPDELQGSNNQMRIFLTRKNDNLNIFVQWNGEYLKWKYKFDSLKFNSKNEDQKISHRNKIIDKWYNYLSEIKMFNPQERKLEATEEDVVVYDDPDLPF
ncbi:MAG: hypothetical protein ACK40U_02870 [Fervidobacterium pennivorans]